MSDIKAIGVFCGSNHGRSPLYKKAAADLGTYLGQHHYTLVYGGGKIGLMGTLADAAIDAHAHTIGVMPTFLKEREIYHPRLDELEETSDMSERKEKMFDLSDAFITLPGGFGTFEEFFEILSWSQMGLHEKPIALLNINGFFDPLLEMLDRSIQEGFAPEKNRSLYLVSDDLEELFEKMTQFSHQVVNKYLN